MFFDSIHYSAAVFHCQEEVVDSIRGEIFIIMMTPSDFKYAACGLIHFIHSLHNLNLYSFLSFSVTHHPIQSLVVSQLTHSKKSSIYVHLYVLHAYTHIQLCSNCNYKTQLPVSLSLFSSVKTHFLPLPSRPNYISSPFLPSSPYLTYALCCGKSRIVLLACLQLYFSSSICFWFHLCRERSVPLGLIRPMNHETRKEE